MVAARATERSSSEMIVVRRKRVLRQFVIELRRSRRKPVRVRVRVEPLEGAFEIALHSPQIKTNSERKPQQTERGREKEKKRESGSKRTQIKTMKRATPAIKST